VLQLGGQHAAKETGHSSETALDRIPGQTRLQTAHPYTGDQQQSRSNPELEFKSVQIFRSAPSGQETLPINPTTSGIEETDVVPIFRFRERVLLLGRLESRLGLQRVIRRSSEQLPEQLGPEFGKFVHSKQKPAAAKNAQR
jgi:hypothetical protein